MSHSVSPVKRFFKTKQYKTPEFIVNLLVLLTIIAIPNSPDHGALLLLIFVSYALYWLVKKKPILLNKEIKVLLVFISVLLLFFIAGAIWQPEGLENTRIGANIDRYLRWILLLPLLFIFNHITVSWKTLSWAVSLSGLTGMTIALYQVHYIGVIRAHAFNNPIPFGEMMVALDLISWILMSYAIVNKERLLSIVLLLGSLASFYAALLSSTRGAWAAYVLMIIVWLVFLYKTKKASASLLFNKQIWFRLIAMVIITLLVMQTDQIKTASLRTMSEIEKLSNDDLSSSAGIRLFMWEKVWEMQKIHPYGVGTRNFKKGMNEILANEGNYRSREIKIAIKFGHAHNQYVNVLAENGWHTLIVFIVFQLYLMVYFYRYLFHDNEKVKMYSSVGLLFVLGYLVFQMTQVVFNHHVTVLFYIFFLYLFYGQVKKKTNGMA